MLKGEGIFRGNTKDETNVINLEDLFYYSRILIKPPLLKAILYLPIGLLLLVLRIVVCFFGVLVLSFLPKTSHTRSIILKGMCKILGLVVEIDDKYLDDSAKLLVANHVSILDRLAVNVMVPCNSISKDFQIKNMQSLNFWSDDIKYSRNLTTDEISALRTYIEGSSIHVLSFPEGTMTNGKLGLLKFHPGIFALNGVVQPVLICVSMSSFITVASSIIGSTACGDLLWAFFLPCTSYTLKVLPTITKYPEESSEDYAKRVQETMADSLNLLPSVYTSSDKDELIKRLKTSTAIAPSYLSTSKINVPVPEQKSSDHGVKTINMQLSMNTAAETFGKTPKQRMVSYQERRAKLLEAAKLKYLQKQTNITEDT